VEGHPLVFRIEGERLYLFHDAGSREGFTDAVEADRLWPKVEAKLAD